MKATVNKALDNPANLPYTVRMSKRKRYDDVRGVGRSALVPVRDPKNPRGHEGPMARHTRRLNVNLDNQEKVKTFCEQHDIKLRINNGGHHWIFEKNDKMLEWWPSSAKLVKNKNWKTGLHVHDYEQAMAEVEKFFKIDAGAVDVLIKIRGA